MSAQRPGGRGVFAENDPHSIAQRAVDGEPAGLTDALAQAIDQDFGAGAMAAARTQVGAPVAVTPIGKKVIDKLNERNERPDVRLKLMVADAREKLAELDDQREKLEAYRSVQLTDENDHHREVQARRLKSIEHYEAQIAALRQSMEQADIDHRAKLLEIENNIDTQVLAIDTMETLHRNVVDSAPAKPKRGKRKADDVEIPY